VNDVTSEGNRLISQWLRCIDDHRRKQQAMWDAQKDVNESEAALIKWLAPPHAKPGEKIAVWFGDSLIQVEMGYDVPPTQDDGIGTRVPTRVTVRSRGKHFEELKGP
jgi:hypothetical protein